MPPQFAGLAFAALLARNIRGTERDAGCRCSSHRVCDAFAAVGTVGADSAAPASMAFDLLSSLRSLETLVLGLANRKHHFVTETKHGHRQLSIELPHLRTLVLEACSKSLRFN